VGEDAADALTVVRTEGSFSGWEVTVAHADGRRWHVVVAQGASAPPRAESCGASVLGSPARMDVVAVCELPTTTALAS
jgi:hypothetical protein